MGMHLPCIWLHLLLMLSELVQSSWLGCGTDIRIGSVTASAAATGLSCKRDAGEALGMVLMLMLILLEHLEHGCGMIL